MITIDRFSNGLEGNSSAIQHPKSNTLSIRGVLVCLFISSHIQLRAVRVHGGSNPAWGVYGTIYISTFFENGG